MDVLQQLARAVARDVPRGPMFKPIMSAVKTVVLADMEDRRKKAALVFKEPRNLLILGGPGAGKTTLLRSRAATLAKAFEQRTQPVPESRVPIFVRATTLKAQRVPGGIVETLAALCRAEHGVEIGARTLGEMMAGGRIELLVDGLDELGFKWNETVAELSDLMRRMHDLRMVVSSRPAALTVNFTNFAAFTIAELNQEQTQRLLAHLSRGQSAVSKRFADEVLGRPELEGFSQSPLMLQLLFDVFLDVGQIPANRSLLYAAVIDVLLNRESQKLRARPALELGERYDLMASIAMSMEDSGLVTYDRARLIRILRERYDDRHPVEELLHELATNGLFTEISENQFGFVHRSFQEFFVAAYYRDNPAGLVPFLHVEGGDAILEFASGLIDNVAMLVEKAVAQGQLVLAAKMTMAGRYENAALRKYVAQAFRHTLGSEFMGILAREARPAQRKGVRSDQSNAAAAPPPARKAPAVTSTPAPAAPPVREPTPAERLLAALDLVRDPTQPNEERGKLFEEFSVAFFGQVFNVVERNRLTDRGEIDLLLDLSGAHTYWHIFGNEALVECKNLTAKVTLAQASTFIAKVQQSRRKLGFIIAFAGFTKDAMQAVYDCGTNQAAVVIIAITGDDVRKMLQLGGSVDEFLRAGYRDVTMPRRGRR
nr:NACHT domain-containing protein [uncultured Sphingomonas sp.]